MQPAADDHGQRVRDLWNSLASTPWRDFYVASHAGWDDPAVWQAQAAADLGHFLSGVGARWLAQQHVLEIGCGVGRLARALATAGRSYTGVDISKGMLEEARRRCDGIADLRLLLGSGSEVPALARDRRYGLILAVAVFIHCPLELIAASVRSAAGLLAPGGTFRLQLRVEANDRDMPVPDAPALQHLAATDDAAAFEAKGPIAAPAEAVPDAALALTAQHDYGGHPFRVGEARAALASWAPGCDVALYRPAEHLLYAVLRRHTAADAEASASSSI